MTMKDIENYFKTIKNLRGMYYKLRHWRNILYNFKQSDCSKIGYTLQILFGHNSVFKPQLLEFSARVIQHRKLMVVELCYAIYVFLSNNSMR